jgi:hypothetical protein
MGDRVLTAEPTTPHRSPVPAERAAAVESYPEGVTLASLPGRDLTQPELEELVVALARDPGRWRNLVAFDAEERVYVSLHRDQHVDVWLLCWTPENDTGWHDHDISSGAVAVVSGELVENNLTLVHGSRETSVRAGTVFSFGGDHIHRLNGAAPASVSVHAYSPPLWRMGQYGVDEGGVLRRVSLSYADELRPID